MNILEFAAGVDAAYRKYCSEAICYPFTVEWTWTSDFVIAMVCEKNGETGGIKQTFDGAINAWKKNFTAMRDLVTALNYLCWFTYEGEETYKEFSPIFSDLYYKALDIAYENLSEVEQSKLWHIIDLPINLKKKLEW